MKKVPTGYEVNVTYRVHSLLEQGDIVNKVVIVEWDAVEGLTPETDLQALYNDLYTYQDMVYDTAYGRCGDQSKVRVVHKGQINSKANLTSKIIEILDILVDHASEKYPHFESERGQRELMIARALLAKVKGKL